ncbi:MAG: LysR family transcriptional regulator [Candidatus Abyssobacteria bacterium SURF_17]|uniref:LysR family transcriptional regulator n=1 Tax=Candidatus Abyssobacteria bacterium SURF_17 TaxID=2093361 RepID=A0A419FA52_9BACT|nr:MAG: LysR family transcriptional regulator [Candidatus Abyssubacteria bacterium SURF_17]
MKFRFKIWGEVDEKPVLGPGRFRLLAAVKSSGSINSAAKEIGISYRRSWAQIREMERLLGYSLIASKRGGKSGGGTTLTPRALKLMKQYERLCRRIDKAIMALGVGVTE